MSRRRSYETDETYLSRLDAGPAESWEVSRPLVTSGVARRPSTCVRGDGRRIAQANGLCAECGRELGRRLEAAAARDCDF